MANNTAYLNAWHALHSNSGSTKTGLRCPIDDRGVSSNKDRPFVLGSQDLIWKNGSINQAVYETFIKNGGIIDAADLVDALAGKLDLLRLNKYSYKDMLYGYLADAHNTIPGSLMAYRGYPTPPILSLEIDKVELNTQNATQVISGLSLTLGIVTQTPNNTEQLFYNQNALTSGDKTSLGITDLIMVDYKIKLTKKIPYNSFILKCENQMEVKDNNGVYQKFYNPLALTKYVEVTVVGDGSGDTFYFRILGGFNGFIGDDGTDITDRTFDFNINTSLFTVLNDNKINNLPASIVNTSGKLYAYKLGTWRGDNNLITKRTLANKVTGLNAPQGNKTNTDFILNWDAYINDYGLPVAKYYIRKENIKYAVVLGEINTLAIVGEADASISNWSIVAEDVEGNIAPASLQLSVALLDTTAPSPPSNVHGILITDYSFKIATDGSTDNVGVYKYHYRVSGGSITGYYVPPYSLAVNGSTSKLIGTLTPDLSVPANNILGPGLTYQLEMQAEDASGNFSTWSTAVPVTTTGIPI